MQLEQGATLIEISLIGIPEGRQRGRGFETQDLELSIAQNGLFHPIVIAAKDPDEGPGFWVRAGERRLTACRNLGHSHILARRAESLTLIEAQILELEENIKRLDIEWVERVKAVARIHELYCMQDTEWTLGETARACSLSVGIISMYASVAEALDNPRIAEAATVREAYNVIRRKEQRAAGDALQALLGAPDLVDGLDDEGDGGDGDDVEPLEGSGLPSESLQEMLRPGTPGAHAAETLATLLPQRGKNPLIGESGPRPAFPESILIEDFLRWAPLYTGEKFNLLHCDFPYGVGYGTGPQSRGSEEEAAYEDTPEIYWSLMTGLCGNLDRFLSISAHVLFWTSASHGNMAKTLAFFQREAPSLSWYRFPLIWAKSNNSGVASDPRQGPRHTYEVALLGTRGSRNIVKVKADLYSAPSDPTLHPSTKPVPMLKHFFEMLVDEHTQLLDPTCGSGASLRAAEALGAKRVLGLEVNPKWAEPARTALRNDRAMIRASKNMLNNL